VNGTAKAGVFIGISRPNNIWYGLNCNLLIGIERMDNSIIGNFCSKVTSSFA